MVDGALRSLAFLCSFCGMAFLALAMNEHQRQVRGPLDAGSSRRLRQLGTAALGASFACCFGADHPSMAALLWVMMLTGAALSVAMILAWRPRWLALLILWIR